MARAQVRWLALRSEAFGPHRSIPGIFPWGTWGISHWLDGLNNHPFLVAQVRHCPQYRCEPAYDGRAREVLDTGLQT